MTDGAKRSHIDIIYDILSVLRDKKDPVVPTHLLYKSNLSHDRLKKYVEELGQKGFIQEVQDKRGKKRYQLTEAGYKFLQGFGQLREFTKSFGL
jgi:predicted transcriptional regulator